MTCDAHESSCGEAVIFEVILAIGTKLHRWHVGVFVGGRLLINVVTHVGLVNYYRYTVCTEGLF